MIIFAIDKKGIIYAYNEKREKILSEPGELYHYTENTIVIKREQDYYIYDEKASLIATYGKDFVDISNIAGIIV